MKRVGLAGVALAVGCFGGVAFREVVFPARAASGPTYGYKVVDASDLVQTVKARNPKFADADVRSALEEGMNGLGRGGWRYVGCTGMDCHELVFEQGGNAGVPAATSAGAP